MKLNSKMELPMGVKIMREKVDLIFIILIVWEKLVMKKPKPQTKPK